MSKKEDSILPAESIINIVNNVEREISYGE